MSNNYALRAMCQSENCNKSFYTFHTDSIQVCPYCLGEEVIVEGFYTINKATLDTSFADKVKKVLSDLQLSPDELAKLVGVSSLTVLRWSEGITEPNATLIPYLLNIFKQEYIKRGRIG